MWCTQPRGGEGINERQGGLRLTETGADSGAEARARRLHDEQLHTGVAEAQRQAELTIFSPPPQADFARESNQSAAPLRLKASLGQPPRGVLSNASSRALRRLGWCHESGNPKSEPATLLTC